MKVKLTEDVGRRRKGEVLDVDEASAHSLVEKRGVAVKFDPETDEAEAERTAPRLGNATAVQVADEDVPPAPSAKRAEGVDGATGTPLDGVVTEQDPPAGDPPADPPSEHDPKHELVARLVEATANTATPVTPEQANQLTKPELVAKLTAPAEPA